MSLEGGVLRIARSIGETIEAVPPSRPTTTNEAIRRIAVLGNHMPRQCGIATFTTDLSSAIDVGNVAFPCGYTIGPDDDTINLYYGAADTSIALATGSKRSVLRWLNNEQNSASTR